MVFVKYLLILVFMLFYTGFYRGSIGKEVDTLMILTPGSRLEGESLAMCILLGKRGYCFIGLRRMWKNRIEKLAKGVHVGYMYFMFHSSNW
ncbi:hypothetical protein HanXRQr2_Chr05g0214261 [Helianthus annuus]|uniref:Uncharacterized protein n=1 Tax=Helianthus annuus TaxID=4232 RepID=A0A9K3IZM3_HELAN|nr:hypothetical protein HanXRQr2_Chr05g0214261 [Helianthus annuus]